MPTPLRKGSTDRLLLSPQEALVAGGPAEELERRIQDFFRTGYEHVVIDLRGVPSADSAGVRALVRGHTSAQRLQRRFTLVKPNARVQELLNLSHLGAVLEVVDSLVEAKTKTIPWDKILSAVGVVAVGVALVLIGMRWPDFGLAMTAPSQPFPGQAPAPAGDPLGVNPVFELVKLVAAAVIGMLATVVHPHRCRVRGSCSANSSPPRCCRWRRRLLS